MSVVLRGTGGAINNPATRLLVVELLIPVVALLAVRMS